MKNYFSLLNSALFAFIFLLLFNFMDIVLYLGILNNYLILTLISLFIPLVFAIYHINIDNDALPGHIKFLGKLAATVFMLRSLIDCILYLLIYIYGTSQIYYLWDYRNLLLLLSITIISLASRIYISKKIMNSSLNIMLVANLLLLGLFVLKLFSGDSLSSTIAVNRVSNQYLMEIFLPMSFIIFFKEKEEKFNKMLNKSFLKACAGLLIVIVTVIIARNWFALYYTDNLFVQAHFVYFIEVDFSLIIQKLILLISILIKIGMAFLVVNIIFNNRQVINQKSKYKNDLLVLIIILGYTFFINMRGEDTFDFVTIANDLYTLIQIALLVSVVALSFYLGIKKYMKSYAKASLYILSTFPLMFVLYYLYQLNSNTVRYIGEVIRSLNIVFAFFSIFVLVYYTIETISLWYAYNKRLYINEIEQIPVLKQMHIYVLIPCMNEDAVIRGTLNSVLDNDYANLQVCVINDASEDNTAAEVLAVKDSRCRLMNRIKPEAQIGKGEALNWAYYQIIDEINGRGICHEDVLIAIIDADTDIDTDYFAKVNYVFNARPKTTGLQSKVRIIELENDSAQDLEFAEIINASQSLRNTLSTVAFGGNGQFCRLSTLESLEENPWSKSLVEDFDLSTRLYLRHGEQVKNVQFDDIAVRQTGIKDDNQALVKQRVRWAQGNVQSAKYIPQIIKSDKLKKRQKTELLATLIKPWIMAIEYLILIYTLVLITDIIILDGLSKLIIFIIVLFLAMAIYILTINVIWAYLYNRQKEGRVKFKNVAKDTYYLCKFLMTLTQIYPQSIIRHFKSENTWDKTKHQRHS